MLSKRKTPSVPASLIGTWSPDADAFSTVRFTVASGRSGPRVRAVDTSDGERLKVSAITWDGSVLRFRVCTPSTRWLVDHEWRATGRSKIEIRYTLTETWTKAPGLRLRDNRALQTGAAARRR